MSDTSQGPGWWMASDGKWYPPSAQPAAPPHQPAGHEVPRPVSGTGRIHDAWRRFRHLQLGFQIAAWGVAAFVALGAIGAAAGSGKPHPAQVGLSIQSARSFTTTAPEIKAAPTTRTTPPTTVAPTTTAPTTLPPTTTVPAQPPTTSPVTAPPVTSAPVTAAPVTAAPVVQPTPITSPAAAPTGCYPKTNSGGCYEPGEYCRTSDHGVTGVAGDGENIKCDDNNGWRWEPV